MPFSDIFTFYCFQICYDLFCICGFLFNICTVVALICRYGCAYCVLIYCQKIFSLSLKE
jgi:hypothetical protein